MKITAKEIKALNPCTNRFNNFIEHYPDYSGDFLDFLALENITYDDKVWVAVRVLNKNQLAQWSIACAESVKHLYEDRYPKNKSLSNLLNYLKDIPDFTVLTEEQKSAISDLRRAAAAAAAYAAAYDADAAAAYAAHATDAAAHAAYDATYAAAYDAAAAAYAAHATDAAIEEQRNLNLLYLSSLIED